VQDSGKKVTATVLQICAHPDITYLHKYTHICDAARNYC